MGKYNGAVITTAGTNVISQAISGTELTWTVMRSSSVAIPEGTDIAALTSLTGIVQTAAITYASVYGSNTIQVSARFSNTGVETAYPLETIGIYGQLAGGAETLIAVMTAVTPDQMPVYDADSPSAFIYNSQITVQDAASITMTVNDTGTATVADLELKVDKAGGDISNTVAATATASSAAYPIPAAGDSIKVILGKIRKFFTDIKAAVVGLSISGRTITWTKADGTTGTLTTQDTTYSNFTKATASAAGTKGLVPAPAAGKQGQFLRGDATWATPTNTTYTAGTGLSLSGTTFNHASTVTAGTAGTSSATSGSNTLAVPYVTYNATGHVTAAGTHTHTISNFSAASSSANGGTGLVPAPTSANYSDRALIYLRSDGGWHYIPLQNNATTTAEHYALDARMGKTLNDKIGTEKSNIIKHTQENATLNTSVLDTTKSNSVNYIHFDTLKLVQVSFDLYMKAGTNTDNSAYLASGLPKASMSSVFIGRYDENGAFGVGSYNVTSTGQLRPWYRGTPSHFVHCFGSYMYTCT